MMYKDLLINQIILLNFWLFHEFNFTCVYFFQTMHVTRSNWQMFLSQTKIFNIFPGSLQISSVIKIPRTVTDTTMSTYHTETFG